MFYKKNVIKYFPTLIICWLTYIYIHSLLLLLLFFVFTRSLQFSVNHVSVWAIMCVSAAWLSSPRSCSSRSRCVITAPAAHRGSRCGVTGCSLTRLPPLAVWNYYTVSCKCPTSQLKSVCAEGLVPPDVYHTGLCTRSTLINVGWMCVGMCVCLCVCGRVQVVCYMHFIIIFIFTFLYAYCFFHTSSTQPPN